MCCSGDWECLTLTLHPEGEGDQGIEAVCTLVVFDELRDGRQHRDGLREMEQDTYAACVPPSASSIFGRLWRLPRPRPFKGIALFAAGRVVTNQIDVGVAMYIRIRIELTCDESVQVFWCR